jgi:hypothetical protein
VVVGLESPALATDLGNRAFPHLPVDARTQIMGRLEHEAALGKIFEEVTPAMKPFWFERLRNNQEAHDWSDPRSLRALEDLVQRNRYVWHGWGIIQQMLPPERWAQVEGRLQQQAQQVAQSTPSAASFPTWIVIPILIIGLNVLRFVGSDSSSFRSKPSYAPTMYDKSERERWEKERREKEIFESVWNATKPSSTVDPNGKLTIPSVMDPPGKDPRGSPVGVPGPAVNPWVPPLVNPPSSSNPAQGGIKTGDDLLRPLRGPVFLDGTQPVKPAP